MTSRQGKGFSAVANSPSFRHSKSFNSSILKESHQQLLSKDACSENSKVFKKANGASKPGDTLGKPKQMDDAKTGLKGQNHALEHPVGRSEVKSHGGNGVMLKSDSSRVSRDILSSAAKTPGVGVGVEENFDPHRKLKGSGAPRPAGGGSEKNASLRVNIDPHRKGILEGSPKSGMMGGEKSRSCEVSSDPLRIKLKEAPPAKASMGSAKSAAMSGNADPHKKLKEMSPKSTMVMGGDQKRASGKSHANLCTECQEALEGAVCFIGNDGRVSACTSRTAVRLCKNSKCANNSPEYVASLAAALPATKKYLVSRRHSFNARTPPATSSSSSKTFMKAPVKLHEAQSRKGNGGTSPDQSTASVTPAKPCFDGDESPDLYLQGELEDDHVGSLENPRRPLELAAELDCSRIGSSPSRTGTLSDRRSSTGYQRMRRRSFCVIETQGPEGVTLRKQMMQERKQTEAWMLDYAIEEALRHRLAPSGESKVKLLVEAFESIIPHKDMDTQDQLEGPKTPQKSSTGIYK